MPLIVSDAVSVALAVSRATRKLTSLRSIEGSETTASVLAQEVGRDRSQRSAAVDEVTLTVLGVDAHLHGRAGSTWLGGAVDMDRRRLGDADASLAIESHTGTGEDLESRWRADQRQQAAGFERLEKRSDSTRNAVLLDHGKSVLLEMNYTLRGT